MGGILIAATVQLGMICFAGVLASWAAGVCGPRSEQRLRLVWTWGWLMMLGHLLAAFHFQHGWSHAQAVAETAKRTRELTGWDFGGGIYCNYLFLIAWGVDVGWWWFGQIGAIAYQPVRRGLLAYLVFIALNGVIVFEDGWLRWAGIAATAVILSLGLGARRGRGPRRAF